MVLLTTVLMPMAVSGFALYFFAERGWIFSTMHVGGNKYLISKGVHVFRLKTKSNRQKYVDCCTLKRFRYTSRK